MGNLIINGKLISDMILDNIKYEYSKHKENKRCQLVVVTIGDDPASKVYVNNKKKACEYVGFKFINKKYHFKKRIILNSVFLISSILFLMITDIISVKIYNRIPRYYINDVVNTGGEGIIYLETLFYDAYACYDWSFTIIPPSIKHYDEYDAVYLRDKYCSDMNKNTGGEEK